MHRYWLRVCTNLALSIYWIQKKNDAISVHAYHLLLNCLLEKTQIYRELNSLSHALCRAQPRSVCRLCPARQQELQPWQGRLRHQRSHGRPAERMLRRSLLMFILHTSAQSPYWSWRPVPLGEPLVSATGYWRTTNQGVWILENQTHLMCIGMDPLSIIVHVYNGTAHSPRSHLLCRADFQLWRLLTPWGMTTTCPTTSSGNTNNVSALRTWGRQCRRHPNTQAGSKRGHRRRNPRPNQLYGRLQ